MNPPFYELCRFTHSPLSREGMTLDELRAAWRAACKADCAGAEETVLVTLQTVNDHDESLGPTVDVEVPAGLDPMVYASGWADDAISPIGCPDGIPDGLCLYAVG